MVMVRQFVRSAIRWQDGQESAWLKGKHRSLHLCIQLFLVPAIIVFRTSDPYLFQYCGKQTLFCTVYCALIVYFQPSSVPPVMRVQDIWPAIATKKYRIVFQHSFDSVQWDTLCDIKNKNEVLYLAITQICVITTNEFDWNVCQYASNHCVHKMSQIFLSLPPQHVQHRNESPWHDFEGVDTNVFKEVGGRVRRWWLHVENGTSLPDRHLNMCSI